MPQTDETSGVAEWPEDQDARDEAATFVLTKLAERLGVEDWSIQDGTESWSGDVESTMHHILVEARVIDDWDGSIARHRTAHAPQAQSVVEAWTWQESWPCTAGGDNKILTKVALEEPDAAMLYVLPDTIRPLAALSQQPDERPMTENTKAIEAIQAMIDNYSVAGANLLDWLTQEDRDTLPPSAGCEIRDWGSDVACRATFRALKQAKDILAALTEAQDTKKAGT